MRSNTTSLRRSQALASQVLFVLALFALLLLGRSQAHAATLSTAAATEVNILGIAIGQHRPDYHQHNAEFWRVKGERTAVRRKGLLGWMLPKRSRHELAEKRRAAHRAPHSAHYRGRKGRKDNLLQLLGLAY